MVQRGETDVPKGPTMIERVSSVGWHQLKVPCRGLQLTDSPNWFAVLPSLSLPVIAGSKPYFNVVDGRVPTKVGRRANLQSNVRTRHV